MYRVPSNVWFGVHSTYTQHNAPADVLAVYKNSNRHNFARTAAILAKIADMEYTLNVELESTVWIWYQSPCLEAKLHWLYS